MISASQIKNELAFYLAGVLSLNSFEDWFVLQTWNVSNAGSRAAEIVTFEIEAQLSEYSSGYISEKQLREEFSKIVQSETRSVNVISLSALSKPANVLSLRGSVPVPQELVRAQLRVVSV
jgi:hypothetical protein